MIDEIKQEKYKSQLLNFDDIISDPLKFECRISEPEKSQFLKIEPLKTEYLIPESLNKQFSKVQKSKKHRFIDIPLKSTFLKKVSENLLVIIDLHGIFKSERAPRHNLKLIICEQSLRRLMVFIIKASGSSR